MDKIIHSFNRIQDVPLSNSVLLEMIKPIITFNDQTLKQFMVLINQKELPISWCATIIKDLKKCRNYRLIIEKYINTNTTISNNQKNKVITSGPIPTISNIKENMAVLIPTTYNLEAKDIEGLSNNDVIIDIMFNVYFEEFNNQYRKDGIATLYSKIISLQEDEPKLDLIERIKLSSYSCVFIGYLSEQFKQNNDDLESKLLELFNNSSRQIKDIFNRIFNNSNQMIQSVIYQFKLFSMITNEINLLKLFKSQGLLNLIGLSNYFNSLTLPPINKNEFYNLPFEYDISLEEYQIFIDVENSIRSLSINQFKTMIMNERFNNPKSKGLFRMILFILSYKYYLANSAQQTQLLISIVKDDSISNRLSILPYIDCYLKILQVSFNDEYHIDKILKTPINQQKAQSIAIINFIALSIGSDSSHLSLFLRSKQPTDTIDPLLVNIGIQKTFPPGPSLIDCYVKTAYGITRNLDFNVLVSSTWCVIAYACSVRNIPYTYNNSSDYTFARGFTSILDIEIDETLSSSLIEPYTFISLITFRIWVESYNPTSQMVSSFNATTLKTYSTKINEIITSIKNDYNQYKLRINNQISQSSIQYQNLFNIRQLFSNTNQSLLLTNDQIQRMIASKDDDYSPIKKFTSEIDNICLSKYFLTIIKFLDLFYKLFSNKLPQEYSNKSVLNAVDYLIENKFETEESTAELLLVYDQLIECWKTIKEKYSIDVCQRALNVERIIPVVKMNTPIITLISDGISIGWLKNVIDKWLENTQGALVNSCLTNDKLSPVIKSIMESFANDDANKIDIANIPLGIVDENVLLGSTYSPEDYYQYCRLQISKYFSYNKNQYEENINWVSILNNLTISFIYGKVIQNQLNTYNNFPYIQSSGGGTNDPELFNSNNNSLSEPEFIKELKDIVSKVSKLIRHREDLERSIEIKLRTKYDIHSISQSKLEDYHPVDQSIKVEQSIKELLPNVTIKQSISFAKIFISTYSGFRYYYSNIMADPVQTNPRFYDQFEEIKGKILNECDESPIGSNKEKKIYKLEINKIKISKINAWIDYISQVIQIICSNDSKDFIKHSQPDHRLVKLFSKLSLFDETSPSDKFNIFKEVKEETPFNYFAIFMGTLQDTLSHLYIKLDRPPPKKTKPRPNKNKAIINSNINPSLKTDNKNEIPPLDYSNSYGLTKQDVIKYHNDEIYKWVIQLPIISIRLYEVLIALGKQNVGTFQDVFGFDYKDWDKIIPIIKIKKEFLHYLKVFN
ncbi:hypothetical protein ACTA71_008761 [Dictyostelium dimigraforme]